MTLRTSSRLLLTAALAVAIISATNRPAVAAGNIVANRAQINFGTLDVGTSDSDTLTIKNTGNMPVAVSLAADLPPAYEYGGFSSGVLKPNSSVNFSLTFRPPSEGDYPGTITLTSPGLAGGSLVIPVTGAGKGGKLSVAPLSVDFGTIQPNQMTTQTVTVTNKTADPQVITKLALSKADRHGPFSIQTTSPITIPGMGSADVTLQFAPTSAGEFRGLLFIDSKAFPRDQTARVPLRGKANHPLAFSTFMVDFGVVPVGNTDIQEIVVTNNTAGQLAINVARGPLDPTFFELGVEGDFTLNAGQSRTITVRFGARGKCKHKGKLVFTSPGIIGGTQTIPVKAVAN